MSEFIEALGRIRPNLPAPTHERMRKVMEDSLPLTDLELTHLEGVATNLANGRVKLARYLIKFSGTRIEPLIRDYCNNTFDYNALIMHVGIWREIKANREEVRALLASW